MTNFYEMHQFDDEGYRKLFSYQSWRLAILNYIDELEIDNIAYVEAHALTDEAFVLLNGNAILYFAEVDNLDIISFHSVHLEPQKIYRIPKGIFHTHTLSKDAKLLIIEEENTSYDNSPRIYLDDQTKLMLKQRFMEENHVPTTLARQL
jgi:hypothetical protein